MQQFQKILVSSLKGGIGKSTVALGIASALAAEGHKTLLIDCDAGNRCLDLMLGLEDRVLFDLADVMEKRCDATDALISHPERETLLFCPAPQILPQPFSPECAAQALQDLSEAAGAEFVICDSAGSGELMRCVASSFADSALIIATQQPASIRSAERTAILLDDLGALPCRLVISLFEENAAADGSRVGLLSIVDQTHLQTVGVVPRDRSLFLTQEKGLLPGPRSRAGIAFANIAARIAGRQVRLFSGIRKIRTRRVL